MALPVDIQPDDPRHVEIHTEANAEVNRLSALLGAATSTPTAGVIPLYGPGGQILTAVPAAANAATTKAYVDGLTSAASASITDLQGRVLRMEVEEPLPADASPQHDLDLYTTPGYYYQSANASAKLGLNYPAPWAGLLNVRRLGQYSDPTSMVFQTYQEYRRNEMASFYWRSRYGGVWQKWQRAGSATPYQLTNLLTQATGWEITAQNSIIQSGILYVEYIAKRTGAAITGGSTGNITNSTIATLGNSVTPVIGGLVSSTGTGLAANGWISAGRTTGISAIAPNGTIGTNDSISLAGSVPVTY